MIIGGRVWGQDSGAAGSEGHKNGKGVLVVVVVPSVVDVSGAEKELSQRRL